MSTTAAPARSGGARVAVQKFGTFLSGMIMPNIPALIAWGILTAFFIPDGFTPNEGLGSLVGPTIHYLLPLIIASTGGSMVHGHRGAVVGVLATMGAIGGADWITAQLDTGQSSPHMFIGAMILGPLGAWVMKRLDRLWDGKIASGFEMLVNMFSAGIVGFLMMLVGFFGIAQLVMWIMAGLSAAVDWLISTGVLPLVSLIIEPAKVFFLNNALNHGVLTPLGVQQADTDGASILFLLEANPGPGLGVLLAFTVFGIGAARATAPGAALIHFAGGIHEVYFPYVLAKPALLLAMVLGGASGVLTNVLLDTGLRAPASPGSIFAVGAQAVLVSPMNLVGVLVSVLVATIVTFVVASIILRASRKRDLEREDAGDLSAAIARTEAAKGRKSEHLSNLAVAGTAASGGAVVGASTGTEAESTATAAEPIRRIVFACDAGMGSSAMGASVLRNKIKKAGIEGVEVTNVSIANLDGSEDLIVTHQDLTARARQRNERATHVSVENFMNSPKYDDVVRLVGESKHTEEEH